MVVWGWLKRMVANKFNSLVLMVWRQWVKWDWASSNKDWKSKRMIMLCFWYLLLFISFLCLITSWCQQSNWLSQKEASLCNQQLAEPLIYSKHLTSNCFWVNWFIFYGQGICKLFIEILWKDINYRLWWAILCFCDFTS